MEIHKIRRVVTGIDETGQSVFVGDNEIEAKLPPLLNGNQIIDLYGHDELVTVPNNGEIRPDLRFFPTQPGGYRYNISIWPAEAEMVFPDDLEAAAAETERLTPGIADVVSDRGGLHYTSTIDLEYILEGEFEVTLDSGQTTIVKKGDVLIQCGSRHSWKNTGKGVAKLLLVFIGANLDASRFSDSDGH